MHRALTAGRHNEALAHLKKAGYSSGGDIAEDKALIKKAIGEHDKQLHGGKHTKLKLATGGNVHGGKSHGRLDKKGRGHVNVIVNSGAGQAEKQQAMHQGMQAGVALGARAAAAKLGGGGGGPPRPPMAAPPGPAAPLGMPPGPGGAPPLPAGPMQMRPAPGMGGPMRRGGVVDMKLKTGSGGGLARLQKNRSYADGGHIHVRGHVRRKNGGAV